MLEMIFYAAASTHPMGLYFMWNNTIYHDGDTIPSMDIGNQPTDHIDAGTALACVTTNVNRFCCRERDTLQTNYTGAVGKWYYPDGSIVPYSNYSAPFNRIDGTCHIHLAKLNTTLPAPLGVYTCEVPDENNGTIVMASITLSDGSITGQ